MPDPTEARTLLKQWRKRLKYTQATLAEKAGFAQTTISEWERGSMPIDARHWSVLARVLELTKKEIGRLRDALLNQFVEAA